MSKSKLSLKILTRGDIYSGSRLVRLGSRIERYYIRGIKGDWAFFSDGHSAHIPYMLGEKSRFRLDLED